MQNRIEFIGVPGSGKTTLAKNVYENFKDKDKDIGIYHDVFNLSVKSYYKKQNLGLLRYYRFLFIQFLQRGNYHSISLYGDAVSEYLLGQLLTVNKLVQTISQDIPVERRKYVLKYLLSDLYKWKTIQDFPQSPNYIIMDEGFSHRLLNIYMFSNLETKTKELNDFFTFIELPKAIIYVSCEVDLSLKRMQRRKKGIPIGFQSFNKRKLYNYLKSLDFSINEFLDYFEDKNVKIIRIKNNNLNASIDQVVKQLTTIID